MHRSAALRSGAAAESRAGLSDGDRHARRKPKCFDSRVGKQGSCYKQGKRTLGQLTVYFCYLIDQ